MDVARALSPSTEWSLSTVQQPSTARMAMAAAADPDADLVAHLQDLADSGGIEDFLDQLVEMFRPQAEAKGLAFIHVRSPMLPQYVRTDEKRLRQILVNLLSNAIKFTSDGTITFEIGYRSQVGTFTVADTGSGISKDDLQHICFRLRFASIFVVT